MYEAVIGYTEDAEVATWGGGETAALALRDAVESFLDGIFEPGDYEATVYDEPMTRDRPDGDSEVYEWRGRGRVTVTITSLDYGVAWTAGAVSWDYTATEVTP